MHLMVKKYILFVIYYFLFSLTYEQELFSCTWDSDQEDYIEYTNNSVLTLNGKQVTHYHLNSGCEWSEQEIASIITDVNNEQTNTI